MDHKHKRNFGLGYRDPVLDHVDRKPRLTVSKRLQVLLTNAGAWLARPWVVGVVLLYTVLWLVFDPAASDGMVLRSLPRC
jgi:hypothetical protein